MKNVRLFPSLSANLFVNSSHQPIMPNTASFRNICTTTLPTTYCAQVEIPRIKVGKKQTLETLINEEALIFAKHLRNERQTWTPRLGLFYYSVLSKN